MKIKAFTLAEVLLTLSIIGVIAAVTIPALNSSNQNKKFLALAKKALVTLQGATDAKIQLTSSVPRSSNNFFGWLTDEGSGDEETLKTIFHSDKTAITPDGMAFCANTTYHTNSSTRFKNTGKVYVDLNGAEGPTQTTADNVDDLCDTTSTAAFDVVIFDVDNQGTFTPSDTKAKQYLGM